MAFEIALQVRLVVDSRNAVGARCPILARQAVRLGHPLAFDQMVQQREHPIRVHPYLFGYPLQYCVRVHGSQRHLERVPSAGLY